MRRYSVAVAVALAFVSALSAQATYSAYDNFNAGSVINPLLWRGQESGGGVREAIRLLAADPLAPANRRLLLLNLSYGGFSANTGTSPGILALNVTDPNTVGGIQATVQAGKFYAGACAVNPAATATMAGLGGAFFNPNPVAPSAAGDVWATLGLERASNATDAANVLAVVARVSQCSDPKCEQRATLAEQVLGTATTSQRVVLAMEWDRANKQFLFQRGGTSVALPYSVNDALAPVDHAKGLLTINRVANCQEAPAAGLMEAYFDDVSTKPMPALPPVFLPDQYEPNDVPGQAASMSDVGDGASQSWHATIHTATDEDWFRLRAVEVTAQSCFPWESQQYRTTIQLTGIPAGSDYDLYVYPSGPGSTPWSSFMTGNAPESVVVPWTGGCADADIREFHIQVRRRAGNPSPVTYTLTVTHARN